MSYSFDKLKQHNSNAFKGKKELTVGTKTSSLATLKSGALSAKSSSSNIKTKVNNYASSIMSAASAFMRENSTELIMIIDKSSSCSGLESATCEGYNDLISKEKSTGFPTKVTTVLFNREVDEILFRTDIDSVPLLRYDACGGTALYDAVCLTVLKVREARDKDVVVPNRTVVAIMTDGDDRDSRRFYKNDARSLVKKCQAEGWEFIFLGSLDNAYRVAEDLGIKLENSKQSINTEFGMKSNFASISNALDDLRNYGRITSSWTSDARSNLQIEDKNVKKLGLK